MKIWKTFYECSCGTEGLALSYEYEEKHDKEGAFPCIDVAFFNQGYKGRTMDLIERIKYCWQVLRTGEPYKDMIILEQKTAKKIAEVLLKFANRKYKFGDK